MLDKLRVSWQTITANKALGTKHQEQYSINNTLFSIFRILVEDLIKPLLVPPVILMILVPRALFWIAHVILVPRAHSVL